jgi:hypothetical protein
MPVGDVNFCRFLWVGWIFDGMNFDGAKPFSVWHLRVAEELHEPGSGSGFRRHEAIMLPCVAEVLRIDFLCAENEID